MSDGKENLRRQISSATDLQSVVRTMKAMAASSIGQFENAVLSLSDYYRTTQLGIAACLMSEHHLMTHFAAADSPYGNGSERIIAVVFGSDQGMVGQFNDVISEYVATQLATLPGKKTIWSVGERIHGRLIEAGHAPEKTFNLPNTIAAITSLVGEILSALESQRAQGATHVYLFHNSPTSTSVYTSVSQQLLPLDDTWRTEQLNVEWPTRNTPEVLNGTVDTLMAFVREYIFVSLFKACAESLASENSSRLAAMQRAEKNIEELLEQMQRDFNLQRQNTIDEELFDVISGYELLENAHTR